MRPLPWLLACACALWACAVAFAEPAGAPAPGTKTAVHTIGTAPQVLTAREQAKRSLAPAPFQPAPPRPGLAPAPWRPPGALLAAPAARAAARAPAAAAARDPRAEVRAMLAHVSHGDARASKSEPAATVGRGPAIAPGAADDAKARRAAAAAGAHR